MGRYSHDQVSLSSRSRNPPLFPPSLALSSFPRPSSTIGIPSLHVVLSEVLPLCSLVPLSLHFLNGESFEPESKEEDLHAGVLQVPPGTTIIVTEGGIKEGELVEKGRGFDFDVAFSRSLTATRTRKACAMSRLYGMSRNFSLSGISSPIASSHSRQT